MKTYFIIPEFNDTGPVKGIIALAKAISQTSCDVIIICLAKSSRVQRLPNIQVQYLEKKTLLGKFTEIQNILNKSKDNIIVSMNFKTDFVIYFLKNAKRIQYIRADLYQNYRYSFGLFGLFLAKLNYMLSNRLDGVIALNEKIFSHINNVRNKVIIGNMIDEKDVLTHTIENYPITNAKIKFIFVGSLSRRKCPDLLIEAAIVMQRRGLEFELWIVGTGPRLKRIQHKIKLHKLSKFVRIFGHVSRPYALMAQCDVFVLPSYSEGISRAMLETQFLGLPSILRNTDASRSYITCDNVGDVFDEDEDLINLMIEFTLKKVRRKHVNLMPKDFQAEVVAKKFLEFSSNTLNL